MQARGERRKENAASPTLDDSIRESRTLARCSSSPVPRSALAGGWPSLGVGVGSRSRGIGLMLS